MPEIIIKALKLLCGDDFKRFSAFLDVFGDDLAKFLPILNALGGDWKKVAHLLFDGCGGDFTRLHEAALRASYEDLPGLVASADGDKKALAAAVQGLWDRGGYKLGGKDVSPDDVREHRLRAIEEYAEAQSKLPPPEKVTPVPRPQKKPPSDKKIHTLADLKKDDHDDNSGGGGGPGKGGGMLMNQGGGTVTLTETQPEPKTVTLKLRGGDTTGSGDEKGGGGTTEVITETQEKQEKQEKKPVKKRSERDAHEDDAFYTDLHKMLLKVLQGMRIEGWVFDQRMDLQALLDAPNDQQALQLVLRRILTVIQQVLASAKSAEEADELQRRIREFLSLVMGSDIREDIARVLVNAVNTLLLRAPRPKEDESSSMLQSDSDEDTIEETTPKKSLTNVVHDEVIEDPPTPEKDEVIEDNVTSSDSQSDEEPKGYVLGRKQLQKEVSETAKKLRTLVGAGKKEKRARIEFDAVVQISKKIAELMESIATAGPTEMKRIRQLLKALEEAAWRLEKVLEKLKIQDEKERLEQEALDKEIEKQMREAREELESYTKKDEDEIDYSNDNSSEDEDEGGIILTWSWGTTIEGELAKLRDDGIWEEIEPITVLLEQPQYVSVNGSFCVHSGLQSFHSVGKGLYESYLETGTKGSGSELRCFFRVKWRKYQGKTWVHFTIIAVADHVLSKKKVTSERFGSRKDPDNPPPGFPT